MSISTITPMIMSKFQYVLQRRIGKSHPDLYQQVKELCFDKYPIFRLSLKFTDEDHESETYNKTHTLPDEMLLEFQSREDEPWSKMIFNDDIDMMTILFQRVVENAYSRFKHQIGSITVSMQSRFDESDQPNDILIKTFRVNRNDKERMSESEKKF